MVFSTKCSLHGKVWVCLNKCGCISDYTVWFALEVVVLHCSVLFFIVVYAAMRVFAVNVVLLHFNAHVLYHQI